MLLIAHTNAVVDGWPHLSVGPEVTRHLHTQLNYSLEQPACVAKLKSQCLDGQEPRSWAATLSADLLTPHTEV